MILSIQNTSKEREKNLNFPQESHKDQSIETHNPAIHLQGWAKHFEHEYIIKLFIKRSCPPSIKSNAEFRSRAILI